jgi:4-amino-4-deoxy-L-arabinose transferase-like glycosyltransferase
VTQNNREIGPADGPRGLRTSSWGWPALGAIVLLYLGAYLYWHSLDRSPLYFDQSLYYWKTMQYYWLVSGGNWVGALQSLLLAMGPLIMPLRPSLVPFLTSLTYLPLGHAAAVAALTVMGSGVLLLVLTYLAAKRWLGSAGPAVFSAFLLLMLPAVAILTRHYYTEVPMAAVCALAVYLLLREDVFLTLWPTLALGATVGIGMWVRETFPLFVAGPLLVAVVQIFLVKENKRVRKDLLGRFLIAAGLAVLVALPFYWSKLYIGWAFLERIFAPNPQAPGALSRLIAYLYMFSQLGVSIAFILLLLAAGIVLGVRRLRNRDVAVSTPGFRRGLGLMLAWLLLPLAVSSVAPAPDIRYLVPALPAFAILMAAALFFVRPIAVRVTLILLAIGIGLTQFVTLSFAGDSPRLNVVSSIDDVYSYYSSNIGGTIAIKQYGFQLDSLAAPMRSDWKRTDVIDAIERRREAAGLGVANVFIVPWTDEIFYLQYVADADFKGYPMLILGADGRAIDELEKQMVGSDYVIVKDGPPYGDQSAELLSFLSQQAFRPTSDVFPLPDGTNMVIYERVVTQE